MNSKITAAALVAACSMLGACATVTRGTHTDFKVESVPSGAAVKTTTGFTCATPCQLKLPRKDGFDVTITLEGYQPQTVHVSSKVQGGGAAGFVGNAVVGGVLGGAIDASSGAMKDLVPNPVKVKLQPVSTAPAAGGGQ
jgi:hypothetical protein